MPVGEGKRPFSGILRTKLATSKGVAPILEDTSLPVKLMLQGGIYTLQGILSSLRTDHYPVTGLSASIEFFHKFRVNEFSFTRKNLHFQRIAPRQAAFPVSVVQGNPSTRALYRYPVPEINIQ